MAQTISDTHGLKLITAAAELALGVLAGTTSMPSWWEGCGTVGKVAWTDMYCDKTDVYSAV